MKRITRYSLSRAKETQCHCAMIEDNTGKYILYDDLISEAIKYRTAIMKQEARIMALKSLLWEE